jgi:hypothetical protein
VLIASSWDNGLPNYLQPAHPLDQEGDYEDVWMRLTLMIRFSTNSKFKFIDIPYAEIDAGWLCQGLCTQHYSQGHA